MSTGQGLLDALQMWDNKSGRAACDYSYHMAVTWWDKQVFDEMAVVVRERGINTFKHFMAYKGALMVNDDELYASFQRCAELGATPLVHAENGDVVAELSAKLPVCNRARCLALPPITAPLPPSRNATVWAISPRSRMAPAGWRIGCRCCGPMGSAPGG